MVPNNPDLYDTPKGMVPLASAMDQIGASHGLFGAGIIDRIGEHMEECGFAAESIWVSVDLAPFRTDTGRLVKPFVARAFVDGKAVSGLVSIGMEIPDA